MKKILITAIIALAIGALLGVYSYNKFKEDDTAPVFNNQNQVFAIQVGVFDDFNNASNVASKYGGIVYLDGNKYRVYIAIVSNLLNQLKNYYDEKGISYYIRTIEVSNEFYSKLKDYETVLNATTKDNYDGIIKNILKEYENLNE